VLKNTNTAAANLFESYEQTQMNADELKER